MKLELRPSTRVTLRSLFDASPAMLEIRIRQMESQGWERHGPMRKHEYAPPDRIEYIQTMVLVEETHP